MKFGIDRLQDEPALRKPLAGRRVALLAHAASVNRDLVHSLDVIAALGDIKLSAVFGPQHGLRGDKQDNMVESPDFTDPVHGIPVFSLYGKVRRPTTAMMESFDVLLVDLQDVGCRIYTFITTLRYVLEAAAQHGKAVWILDRPNPAGRPIEGLMLRAGWESFVGAAALPMRHGLTLGGLAKWFVRTLNLNVECEVVTMEGWKPESAPGYGWPLGERAWVNPSPNARICGWRVLCGNRHAGERRSPKDGARRGRWNFGADSSRALLQRWNRRAHWLAVAALRPCWFEPTFQKHAGALCGVVQIHVDDRAYDHARFRPWRLQALAFKALRALQPEYPLWREFVYEYERDRRAIDLINGSGLLRVGR